MFVWAAACLALAVVWIFVWPSDRAGANRSGLHFLVLRWGHALCWLLLAVSCFVRGMRGEGPANLLALAALGVYALFVANLVTAR